MNKRKTLAVLATAGSIAFVALIWMLARSGESEESEARPTREVAEAVEVSEEGGAQVPEPLLDPGSTELAEVARTEERVAEELPAELEPSGGGDVLLSGHVQLPAATPADERVVVLAVDHPRKLRQLAGSPGLFDMAWDPERQSTNALVASADVAPDGSFQLELPAGTETAHLAVTGRYLFSMATTAVPVGTGELPTLTGELGAWVTGTLLPPPDPSTLQSDFEWIELELGPDVTAGFDTARVDLLGVTRETEAAADGSFEFRGIPGTGGYGISVAHGHLAAHLQLGVDPDPGEHVELELQMIRGATLRGQVVDAAGAPVSEASIEARWRGAVGDGIGSLRETATEDDGTFELEHVAIGKVDLLTRKGGLLENRLKLEGELKDGDQRSGLSIVMESGASLEGWVTFPDGTPAEGVEVLAGADLSQLGGLDAMNVVKTRGGNASTDEDGHFMLPGVTESKFQVTAQLEVEEGERAGVWRATEKGVKTDGEPLRLVLEGMVALRGRVVDQESNPITEFRVRATLQGSGAMFGIGAERRSQSFEDAEDGSFQMERLTQEVWELDVTSEGFATSPMQAISLPQVEGAPEPLFVLEPAAGVAGLVLDTGGAPVAGARVTLDLDIGTRMTAMQGDGIPEVFTDVEGRFLMEGLDPGPLSLVGSFEGFAASAPVACEVFSSQVTEDVVLELRVGGTLTGIVYDDQGEPAPGRMVIVQFAPTYASQHMMTSDERGEFRREHLEPGTWQVIATENFMSGDSSIMEEEDMGNFIGNMKMAAAEIIDGELTHVELGAPPADPVLLRGRVTHAGAPVAGAMVSMMPQDLEGMGVMSGLKMKVTDASGAFEVQLDRPGGYLFTAQTGVAMGNQNSVEFIEQIPEGEEEHELELELPGGRISGLVRGPDGSPLAACRLTVNVEGGMAYGSLMGGNYVEIKTDADGRYDAMYLRKGTYTVAAGGVPLGGMLGGKSEGGRSVRGGVRLSEGQWLESVDFRLEAPAELTGTVLEPTGTPVVGASVFVRDEAGMLLERFSLATTDGAGRFTYPGLAPGRYRVSARKGDQVSDESAPVSVTAGGTAEASVTLVQGTVLLIAVVDKTGADLKATVSVVDSDGRELSGMVSMNDILEGMRGGFSTREHRVGPVADGKYTVTAVHADGRKKTRSVRVSGQGERKVKLRLD